MTGLGDALGVAGSVLMEGRLAGVQYNRHVLKRLPLPYTTHSYCVGGEMVTTFIGGGGFGNEMVLNCIF